MSASAGGTPTPRPSPGGPARPAQLPEEGPGRDPAPASRQPAAGLTLLGPQVRGGAVQLLEAQQRGLQVGTCNREGVKRRPGPAGGTGSGAALPGPRALPSAGAAILPAPRDTSPLLAGHPPSPARDPARAGEENQTTPRSPRVALAATARRRRRGAALGQSGL